MSNSVGGSLPIDHSHSFQVGAGSIPSDAKENFPLFPMYLHLTPERSKFTAVLLKFTLEPILFVIQYIFNSVLAKLKPNDLMPLHSTTMAQLDQMSVCIDKFNKEDNHAFFMNPNFCQLEANGDWYQEGKDKKFVFSKVVNQFYEDNRISEGFKEDPSRLRKTVEKIDKPILAMLINVENRHWTSIHFNFNDNTVSYVESRGTYVGRQEETAGLIEKRLQEAKSWVESQDPNHKWTINKAKPESPSALPERTQFDKWQCGTFALQLTYMAGEKAKEGKSSSQIYEEIAQTPFNEMQRQIYARRAEMQDLVAQRKREISG